MINLAVGILLIICLPIAIGGLIISVLKYENTNLKGLTKIICYWVMGIITSILIVLISAMTYLILVILALIGKIVINLI
mgnify:CR=1 FL=1